LIAVGERAAAEEKERARQKAEQIRKEILEGKDFAKMAKEHSGCTSAPRGGDLGRIKKGYMPAEFEKVAFALEKDAVSEVVETKFGFHHQACRQRSRRCSPQQMRSFSRSICSE
jgi:peptidyl-prolyl cis-trans isomerase C